MEQKRISYGHIKEETGRKVPTEPSARVRGFPATDTKILAHSGEEVGSDASSPSPYMHQKGGSIFRGDLGKAGSPHVDLLWVIEY